MLHKFFKFDTVANSAQSTGIITATASAIVSIAFFICLDRAIKSQNDISDGATRGIFSFIVGPIVTYYAASYGAMLGAIAGGAGRLIYNGIKGK